MNIFYRNKNQNVQNYTLNIFKFEIHTTSKKIHFDSGFSFFYFPDKYTKSQVLNPYNNT